MMHYVGARWGAVCWNLCVRVRLHGGVFSEQVFSEQVSVCMCLREKHVEREK